MGYININLGDWVTAAVIWEANCIPRLRYSLATLLILVTLGAVVVRWYTLGPKDGIEEWTEHCLLEYSVGIAELSYQKDRWNTGTVISGDGNYCHICEGGRILNSTGSWYFSIAIQLPKKLEPGLTLDLKNVHLAPDREIKKLTPGETIVVQFGHPSAWELSSVQDAVYGTLTVDSITPETVSVSIDALFNLTGFGPMDGSRELEIDRRFELRRLEPQNPLYQLPRTSQITKE
ncbi:MAG: hypothetical protein R3C53_02735 [Pirellulaceae bacterium]